MKEPTKEQLEEGIAYWKLRIRNSHNHANVSLFREILAEKEKLLEVATK